jgi:hypothetical protein
MPQRLVAAGPARIGFSASGGSATGHFRTCAQDLLSHRPAPNLAPSANTSHQEVMGPIEPSDSGAKRQLG